MADDRHGLFARPDAPHRVHDLLLVAALAAGDADGADRDRAQALVAGCPDCAALAADLRAIATATSTLPAPARTRDFRLTPRDAERLRPHGVRGLVANVGRPRLARANPIAAGLTMLGLAGILVSTITFSAPVAVPADTAGRQDAAASEEVLRAQASDEAVAPQGGGQGAGAAPAASGAELFTTAEPTPVPVEQAAPPPAPSAWRPVVAAASGVLVLAGVLLFLATSRRRRPAR